MNTATHSANTIRHTAPHLAQAIARQAQPVRFLTATSLAAWAVRVGGVKIIHSRYAPDSMPRLADENLLAGSVLRTLDQLPPLQKLVIWAALAGRVGDRNQLARLLPDRWPARKTRSAAAAGEGGEPAADRGVIPVRLRAAIVDEWIGMQSVRTRQWKTTVSGSHMRIQRHKLRTMAALDDALQQALYTVQQAHAARITHCMAAPVATAQPLVLSAQAMPLAA
ncbi:hypothetical protein IGB42_04133 [Andreprevotia sp. IGB-42]|uniref:hypothetical protein n=1 Tax=Andreprevotia sp. IGB-42 TaxID=2497473 RepID=UPI00135A61DC|nr:hypothetical protein [Andreprevotia sp. IGB-42]KAF0811367.1 hypothetical protein IGB42_04133 [Andreprevotia sp. IGB-42]